MLGRLCGGSDNGCSSRCLDGGSNGLGGGLSSGLSLGGVLERSDSLGLIDLGGVLVDLSRGGSLSSGLGLEDFSNAGRNATAKLDLLLLSLLLFSDLFLL